MKGVKKIAKLRTASLPRASVRTRDGSAARTYPQLLIVMGLMLSPIPESVNS